MESTLVYGNQSKGTRARGPQIYEFIETKLVADAITGPTLATTRSQTIWMSYWFSYIKKYLSFFTVLPQLNENKIKMNERKPENKIFRVVRVLEISRFFDIELFGNVHAHNLVFTEIVKVLLKPSNCWTWRWSPMWSECLSDNGRMSKLSCTRVRR